MAFDWLLKEIRNPTSLPPREDVGIGTYDPTYKSKGYVVPPIDIPEYDPIPPMRFRPTFNAGTVRSAGLYTGYTGPALGGAIFPERVSTDQMGGLGRIFSEVNQLGRGLETFVSPLKLIGDNAVGKAFAGAGESGVGQFLQGTVKTLVVDPLEAAGRLVNVTIKGNPNTKNIFEAADPLAQLAENLKNSTTTLRDMAEIAMILPIFKGAKFLKLFDSPPAQFFGAAAKNMMTGDASKALLKGDFAGWLFAPVKGDVAKALTADVARNWGATAGRITLAASVAGYAEAKAIDALAPDSWASRELAHNMFVPEGNAMRLPLDLVESLPLDIFALAGLAKNGVRAANIGTKLLGPGGTVADDVFKVITWRNVVNAIPEARAAIEWMEKKSLRDVAMWSLLDDFNRDFLVPTQTKLKRVGEMVQFDHPSQIPRESQKAWDEAVRTRVDELFNQYGKQGVRERQYDVIMGVGTKGTAGYRPGWGIFNDAKTDGGRLMNLVDFHPLAKDLDEALHGAYIPGIDYDIGKQLVESHAWLDQAFGDPWTNLTRELWANKFPAIVRVLEEDYGHVIGSMSRDDLLKAIDRMNKEEKLMVDPAQRVSEQMGRLLRDIDVHNEAIIGGKATKEIIAARKASVAELEKIRSPFATEMAKKIQTTEAAIVARREEMAQFADDTYEKWAADWEITHLEELRHSDVKRFFEAATAGTRYSISKTPKGIIQKLFDKEFDARAVSLNGRNRGGAIFDALFGAIPNKLLGLETHKRFENALDALGNSKKDIHDFYEKLEKEVDHYRIRNIFGTSFTWSTYMSVYHLPTFIVNRIAAEAGIKVGKGSAAEVLYRAQYGPVKMFSDKVFNKSVDVPYNAAFVNLTRVAYPIIRFSLSPRFILMNLFEGNFFKTFLAGRNKLSPEIADRLQATAAQITHAKQSPDGRWLYPGDDTGALGNLEFDLNELVGLASGPRADEMTKAILVALDKSPAMQDYLREINAAARNATPEPAAGMTRLWRGQSATDEVKGAFPKTFEEFKETRPAPEYYAASRAKGLPVDTWEAEREASMLHEWEVFDSKKGRWFTTDRKFAETFTRQGKGPMYYVDLPTAEAEKFTLGEVLPESVVGGKKVFQEKPDIPAIDSTPKLMAHVEKTLAERQKAVEGLIAETKQEARLAKEVQDLEKQMRSPLARIDMYANQAALEQATAKYDGAVTARRVRMAAKEAQVNDPRMQPMIDAAIATEERLIRDQRMIRHGNPSRSAIERVGNSFLLYWPLSYQLKAGKALMRFMFDRGFGFKTNLAPAMMYSDASRWIDQKRKEDPEVDAFFKKNRQMIFIVKGFFPATPDEMGVSLGPALRLPLQTFRGYKTPQSALERATQIGLTYDNTMLQDFIKEQSKPGGIFHDIMNKAFGEQK